MLLVSVYLILLFPLIVVSFSPSVFLFRVLHQLPLPLSSCLGCIPPLKGLPSLRFYAVASSLFLLSVCFCLCFLFYRDDILCWPLSCPFSSVCFPCLSPIPGLIWFGSVYLVTTVGFVADRFLLSVCFCLCFLFYRDDILCWLLSCPFSSVCFPCLSSIPGLIWFGSVYLVTTAGFVADRLMQEKQQQQLVTFIVCFLFFCVC